MATHSSILVWRIPWTEEPGGLQSRVTKSQTRLSDLAPVQHVHLTRAAGEQLWALLLGSESLPSIPRWLCVFMFHPRLCARSTGVSSVPPPVRLWAAQPVPSATLTPCFALSVLPGSAGVSWLGVCPSEPLILRREPSDRGHLGFLHGNP